MSTGTTTAGARRGGLVTAFAVLLLAANLRPPVVGVAPLVDQAREELGVSSGVAGLLTSLPVLCFGLLAPVAPRLARRWGLERLLVAALLVLAAGTALRLVGVLAVILAGSVLVGTAIVEGNVSLPTLVKRDFPHRTGAMTGAYSMVLTGGGVLAAAVTVPLQRLTGLDWRLTLGLWGLLTVATLVVWVPRDRRRTVPRHHRVRVPRCAARCCATRWPGRSRCSWDCSRCTSTPSRPGSRRSSSMRDAAPPRPGCCSRSPAPSDSSSRRRCRRWPPAGAARAGSSRWCARSTWRATRG